MAVSFRALGLSALSLVASLSPAAAQLSTFTTPLTSNGLSFSINDVYFYASPFVSGKVAVPKTSLLAVGSILGSFKPVTVVNKGHISKTDVPELLSNWTAIDDVFQPAFAQAIFLAGPGAGTCKDKSGLPYEVKGKGYEGSPCTYVALEDSDVASGPYVLEVSTGNLYPVYRLYEDFAGAFMQSLIPNPQTGTFQTLSAQIPGSAALTIGVPSRLYFTKTAEKPLAGVRLGVKDIYRLAGVKGSNGNRAWYNLYPAANYTGPAIQNLIDAGAQVIGLQKTSQFANGESATQDWVDYHSPFSPRGDGYQDPSSSSSGAGASVAAYEWLDIAIGSDTGGSIRGPAGVGGLLGNRPSHGLVSLDNVMPLSPTLDTPGFLVRDPVLLDAANAALYGKNYKPVAAPRYPKKVISIGFPSNTSTSASAVILNKFLSDLTAFVGGASEAVTLASAWAASPPAGAQNATLSSFMNTTYAVLITKEQIPLVREPLYRDYAAANDGRRPFVNPVPLRRWAYGDSIPDSALPEAIQNKTVFMDWFNEKFAAPVKDGAQCSETLVVYPQSSGGQNPRNRYGSGPGVPFGFSSGRISVFAEIPDHVFPVGEVTAKSAITDHDEVFPVAVSIMAAKGCDGLLTRLAIDLAEKGIMLLPKTGKSAVDGGKILMRRAEMMGY
ncbi:amidase signature domain-containing protein [Podospora conica]|nr:amidase signature domain-containing protein [Schizothecium conicum]